MHTYLRHTRFKSHCTFAAAKVLHRTFEFTKTKESTKMFLREGMYCVSNRLFCIVKMYCIMRLIHFTGVLYLYK